MVVELRGDCEFCQLVSYGRNLLPPVLFHRKSRPNKGRKIQEGDGKKREKKKRKGKSPTQSATA